MLREVRTVALQMTAYFAVAPHCHFALGWRRVLPSNCCALRPRFLSASIVQGDGKRSGMQAAIDEIREELRILRSAVSPAGAGDMNGTTSLPPVKVPPHMT